MTLLVMALVITNVAGQAPFDISNRMASRLRDTEVADYSCKFANSWSAARHPNLYPNDGSAHWSPPVVATHNANYTMWADGGLASPGVERVAFRVEVCDKEVGLTVTVEVGGDESHAGLGLAVQVQRDAGTECGIFKCAVALVDPQLVGVGIVGDIDVDPPVPCTPNSLTTPPMIERMVSAVKP